MTGLKAWPGMPQAADCLGESAGVSSGQVLGRAMQAAPPCPHIREALCKRSVLSCLGDALLSRLLSLRSYEGDLQSRVGASEPGGPDQCTTGAAIIACRAQARCRLSGEAAQLAQLVSSSLKGAVHCTSTSESPVGCPEGRSSASPLLKSSIAAGALHSPKSDSQAADDLTLKLTCKGGAAVWGCTWAKHSLEQVSQAGLRRQGRFAGLHRGLLHPVAKGALRPLCAHSPPAAAGRRRRAAPGSRAPQLILQRASVCLPRNILHCDGAACRQSLG